MSQQIPEAFYNWDVAYLSNVRPLICSIYWWLLKVFLLKDLDSYHCHCFVKTCSGFSYSTICYSPVKQSHVKVWWSYNYYIFGDQGGEYSVLLVIRLWVFERDIWIADKSMLLLRAMWPAYSEGIDDTINRYFHLINTLIFRCYRPRRHIWRATSIQQS